MIKVCNAAIRFFLSLRDHKMIEYVPLDVLYNESISQEEQHKIIASYDINRLIDSMPNQRYAHVVRCLLLEDTDVETLAREMGITTANLYNIKHRALAQLTDVALNDTTLYGKRTHN